MSAKSICSLFFCATVLFAATNCARFSPLDPRAIGQAAQGDPFAVWHLQSRSVARDLNLSGRLAARLSAIHAESMEAFAGEAEAIRREHGANRLALHGALLEHNRARRESLKKQAAAFLSGDKLTSAALVLGAYNDQWSTMVVTLSAFDLGEADLFRSLSLVNRYVAATEQGRDRHIEAGDWVAVIQDLVQNKQILDESLGEILSPEQAETWSEKTRMRTVSRPRRQEPEGGNLPMPEVLPTLPDDHILKITSIEPHPVYKDFLNLRDNGWLGSDVAHSIVLSDEKTLWLFGDTFVGDLANGTRAGGAVMINNAIGIQDRRKTPPDSIEFYWKTNENGRPTSFFPHQPGTPGAYYWPSAGMMLGDELFVYCWSVGGDAQGTGGWGSMGSTLIRIPNPLDPPEEWIQNAYGLDIPGGRVFHASIYVEEPYVYMYATHHGGMALARVSIADLLGGGLAECYEYYVEGPDGPHWGPEPENLVPQFLPINTECTIHYIPEWDLYTVFTYNALTPEIYISTSRKLTGPWSTPAAFYWVPEHHTLPFYIWSYAVRQHPQLSTRPGEVVLSYATNAPGSLAPHFSPEGKDLYYPRFLRIQFELNTAYAGD